MMALESAVEPVALTDTDNSEVAPTAPVLGWFAWIASFFSGASAAPAVAEKPKAALLQSTQPKAFISRKQNAELTAQQTQEDSMHIFEVKDTWGQLEKEDDKEVDQVRRADEAERLSAREVLPVHRASASERKA